MLDLALDISLCHIRVVSIALHSIARCQLARQHIWLLFRVISEPVQLVSQSLPRAHRLTGWQIPWDGAVRAGNLTEDQLKRIRSVDKVRKEQRKQTIEKDVNSYASLLVGGSDGGSVLEKASKRSDIIQYILVLATDLINGRPGLP